MSDQKCKFDMIYGETAAEEQAANRDLAKTALQLEIRSTVNQLRQRAAQAKIDVSNEFRKIKTGNFSLLAVRQQLATMRNLDIEIADTIKIFVELFGEAFE